MILQDLQYSTLLCTPKLSWPGMKMAPYPTACRKYWRCRTLQPSAAAEALGRPDTPIWGGGDANILLWEGTSWIFFCRYSHQSLMHTLSRCSITDAQPRMASSFYLGRSSNPSRPASIHTSRSFVKQKSVPIEGVEDLITGLILHMGDFLR